MDALSENPGGALVFFFQNLIFGVQLGALYALIAIGYTMVYGVLRLINFAHGDVYMVGSYVGLTLAERFGFAFARTLPGFAALFVLTMALCALLGVVIERLAYRPLRRAPRLTALITAIGISLLLETVAQFAWGAAPRFFPTLFSSPPIRFVGLELNVNRLVILLISVVLMAGLWYVVTRTRIGKAMRAVSYDREAAALMGVNTDRVISFTFALGSALAGAAGLLLSALTNVQITPQAGILPGLKAFVAAVLGGIGSIPGAMVGGLVMGVAETFVTASRYSMWRDAVAFVLLILILLFKPAGIMGRATVEKV
jgi:branched-chain amino acid transport system permease protein